MNYKHTPRDLVLGILVSSWSRGSMILGVSLGWMDGWMDSLIHIFTSVDILRREREPLFKKRSRVQSKPHVVDT